MKRATKLLFSALFLLFLTSCFESEVFPETPFIELESLLYRDTEGLDSLILSFRFEDGEGNLGLNDNVGDLLAPYHIYSYIADENDSIVTLSDPFITPPLYKIPILVQPGENGENQPFIAGPREFFSETDNRPNYDCINYEVVQSDTIYVSRNEFYNNFHLEFYKKTGGNYNEIDFGAIFQNDDCDIGNFNGRIPVYDPNGREGVITYSILSRLFRLSFLDDTIQMRFWIYDRDLNKSNVVETPDFVLSDLL
ncbi:MAG: hypothetical protein ABJP45_08165 [Cyclobacteriaceae bacterium]